MFENEEKGVCWSLNEVVIQEKEESKNKLEKNYKRLR